MDALLAEQVSNGAQLEHQLMHGSNASLYHNQPGDRSSLHLNLAPLDDILKEPPTFLSFRGGSQQSTPLTSNKPQLPMRVSPNIVQNSSLHTPTVQSPTILHLQTSNLLPTPTSTQPSSRASSITANYSSNNNCKNNNNNPPTPPPRWAKSTLSTPNSNGTITTTLTFPVNQVQELPLRVSENGELLSSIDRNDVERISAQEQSYRESSVNSNGCQPHNAGSFPNTPSDVKNNGMLRHRDNLDLRIRQSFMSPQSTPCTPCNPTTPISTPMSEEGGESRAKLRKSHRDRRRHSNHYHDVNVIDNSLCYRSSLADKISDYEDVWSSPPRELASSKENPSPKKISRKMSTFKPNADLSKSLGDLSDISQNKSALFTCDTEIVPGDRVQELNGNSFDSIPFRNTNSPFYVEPADCLRENENRARIKKTSNKILSRKIANRYSDSNIQWRSRHNQNFMNKIESNENLNGLSSSAENLVNGFDTENQASVKNGRRMAFSKLSNNRNLHPRNSRGKAVLPPRVVSVDATNVSSDDPSRRPWRLDASWRYQSCDNATEAGRKSSTNSGSPSGDARFPILESNGESESVTTPGKKTVVDLITEKLPNLPLPVDTQSISLSAITKVSEYDNVAIRSNGGRNITEHNNITNNNINNILLSPQGLCMSSSISDSGTEFSEPWDSRKWDSLLHTDDESSIEPLSLSGTPARPQLEEWDRRLNSSEFQPLTSYGESETGTDDDDSSSISAGPMFALLQSRAIDSTVRSKICEFYGLLGIIYFYRSYR